MSITNREILEAREALAEHHWNLWLGDEGANETDVALTRHIGPVNEIQLDAFLEYLRRWVSASNQNEVTVSGSTAPDIDGNYLDTGRALLSYPVLVNAVAGIEIRRVLDADGERFHFVRLSDEKVLWRSNVDAATLGDAVWTAYGLSELTDDLDLYDSFDFTDEGVIEPVTGVLSVEYDVPDSGILYRSVTDPQVNNGKVRDGIWRLMGTRPVRDFDGRYGQKGAWVILQELALELNSTASVEEDDTRWRQKGGENFKSGSRNLVLELPYVDPAEVQALAEGMNADGNVFNSTIYTVNGGLLSGKWYHVDVDWRIDEKTGYGTILWFLRNHDNEDFRFTWQANHSELHVHFFKLNMPHDGIEDFQEHYYFSPSGDFYVSTDGTNYTAKNGETATGALPATAKRLTDSVDGRNVFNYSPRPDEKTGEVDLNLRIVFAVDSGYGDTDETGNLQHDGNAIVLYGEQDESIEYLGVVESVELPDRMDLRGVVADGGRSKTVTRIQNQKVVNGKFQYEMTRTTYSAPQNLSAGGVESWFYHGVAQLTEREKKTLYSSICDNAGNTGWMPFDVLTAGGTGGPVPNIIELAEWRPKTAERARLYFVRRPTTLDLNACVAYTAPGVCTSPEGPFVMESVRQIGRHLYCLERLTTTLGAKAADADALSDPLKAVWVPADQIAVPASQEG